LDLHQAIKKPRTFSGRGSGSDDAGDYARTTPEAREGFPVFVVVVAVVIIGGTIWAQGGFVNGFWSDPKALPSCK
jgi:uncharacterized MAPEG superfamily protein